MDDEKRNLSLEDVEAASGGSGATGGWDQKGRTGGATGGW